MAFRKSHGKHARVEEKNKSPKVVEAKLSDSGSDATDSPAAGQDGERAIIDMRQDMQPTEVVKPIAPQAPLDVDEQAQGEPQVVPPLAALPEIAPAFATDDAAAAFVSAAEGITPTPRRKVLKVIGLTFGIIIGVLLLAYIAGAIVFMGRFLPGVMLGDDDVSFMSDGDVKQLIEGKVADYRIDIVGNGFSYRANGSDFGLSADTDAIVAAMHRDMNAWLWPVLLFEGSHDETKLMQVSYQHSALAPELLKSVNAYNATAQAPVNATIEYNDAKGAFVVKAEQAGTQLNPHAVIEAADASISALLPKLALVDEHLIQPTVLKDDEKLNESAKLATGMTSAHIDLHLAGKPVGVVDGKDLSTFVTVNQSLDVVFNEDALYGWLDNLISGFNTIESTRSYTRADGKEIVVSGGDYGWEVDTDGLREAIVEQVKTGSNIAIEIPCYATAEAYNGPGQRDWGNRYIDVDISEQYVRFFGDDGSIIWESPCISGSPDGKHDTVKGVWSINAKESPSKLIGYENGKKIYESYVTYWMPFEQNSIGFHDATWQPSFGGSMYASGYGSHGCVNLPYSAAQELYGIVQYDDVVVVHD